LESKLTNNEFIKFLNSTCNKNIINIMDNHKKFKDILDDFSNDENCQYRNESAVLLQILNKTRLVEEMLKLIELVKTNCNLSFNEASDIVNIISDIINLNLKKDSNTNKFVNSNNQVEESIINKESNSKVINMNEIPKADLYELAKKGVPEAQLKLGMKSNDMEAFEWITKAAKQGLKEAQFQLGNRYKMGIGTMIDIDKAIFWYKKAADQGHEFAFFRLKEFEKNKNKRVSVNNKPKITKNTVASQINNNEMPIIKKYTTKITLDTSHDTSYRFKTEREAKEALINRLERACREAEKYFDTGHSAKLSRTLAEYYEQQLTNLPSSQRNSFTNRELKDSLESILMKYYSIHNYRKLSEGVDINYNYGKYGYNAYGVMGELQNELDKKVTAFCNDVYEYIIKKFTVNNVSYSHTNSRQVYSNDNYRVNNSSSGLTMNSIIALGKPDGQRYKLIEFYKSQYAYMNEREFMEYFKSLLNRGHAFIV